MAVVAFDRTRRILSKARLQMHVATWLQIVFLAALVAAGVSSPTSLRIGSMDAGTFVIVVVSLSWFSLLFRSLKLGHTIRHATLLISQDQTSRAVPLLIATLEHFSLLRMPKLMAAQYLARIAHDRRDFASAAALSAEVLRHGLARRRGLTVRACLTLADSLIELGDADAAGRVLARLHGRKLRATEQAHLLPVLLRWQMLGGKYAHAVDDLEHKVRLSALLPGPRACMVHVLLAAAANYRRMTDASRFLLRRAALHYDLDRLAQQNASAASYLVQMQTDRDEPADETLGRSAHGSTASDTSNHNDW